MELQPPNPEADTVLVQYYQGTEAVAGLLRPVNIAPGRTTAATAAWPIPRTNSATNHWRRPDLCELMSRAQQRPSSVISMGVATELWASALTPPPWWNWPSQEQPACFLSPSATSGDSDCFASCSIYWMRGLRHPTAALSATASVSSSCPRISSTPTTCSDAQRRLRLSQPRHSPFALVQASTVRHRGCREVRALQFPTDGFHHLAAVCHRKGA